jgi:hypothetical protein
MDNVLDNARKELDQKFGQAQAGSVGLRAERA